MNVFTYSLADFIPFHAETYFRLFERHNEAQWPLHILAIVFGVLAIILAWQGRGRTLAVVLAPAWIWVGLAFHFRLYAELMVAAPFFGWMFLLQGVLVLGCGLSGRLSQKAASQRSLTAWIGAGFATFGVLLYPALALLEGRGWAGSELFGLVPDPTAVATLGLLIMAARIRWLVLLLPIPLLWCILTGATLLAIEAPFAWAPPIAGLIAVLAAGWGGLPRRSRDPAGSVSQTLNS